MISKHIKKTRYQAVHRARDIPKEKDRQINVKALCKKAGISRQAYYKEHQKRGKQEIREDLLIDGIKKIRQDHERMGGRKLLDKLTSLLIENKITIGRDRFFDFLRRNNLLILRRKKAPYTTDSRHGLRTYSNLFKDAELTAPHQAWVSDITYIRTWEGFSYLSLITDAYSRKIVGYHVGHNLEVEGCLKALKMAMRQLPQGAHPIHHSDRGSQYCSHAYTGLLKNHQIQISMTEENHCYENAMAERLNGILKYEYGLKETYPSRKIARIACRQAIRLYCTDRPHMSLGMKTPHEVHYGVGLWGDKCVNF
ncbi:MAG: IS3 family transposase [Acidobacteria bacterium]|nr:IS3 family transposase [Acidobacteriota bacterium]